MLARGGVVFLDGGGRVSVILYNILDNFSDLITSLLALTVVGGGDGGITFYWVLLYRMFRQKLHQWVSAPT